MSAVSSPFGKVCARLVGMKRMKKAVLNRAEGRAAHKFQFELTPTTVGALDRVLKGLDGSSLFVQERPSESNACRHTASTARGCGPRDLRLQPLWHTAAASSTYGSGALCAVDPRQR